MRPGQRGNRRQVGEGARAVVDVREDEQRDVPGGQRGLDSFRRRAFDCIGLEQAQLATVLLGETLQHVAVGRELVSRHDDRAGPFRKQRAGQLVEVDRGRVGDEHLALAGAEHAVRESIADAPRRVDPVVPAGDDARAPVVDRRLEPSAGGERESTERVPVQIDPGLVAEHEALAERAERVGAVERERRLRGWSSDRLEDAAPRRRSADRSARNGRTQARSTSIARPPRRGSRVPASRARSRRRRRGRAPPGPAAAPGPAGRPPPMPASGLDPMNASAAPSPSRSVAVARRSHTAPSATAVSTSPRVASRSAR